MKFFLNDTSAEFVGYRLTAFQEAQGIDPSEFENRLGWSQQKWDLLRAGECIPEVLDMISLSEMYNVTLDYIFRGDMSNLPRWMSQNIRALVSQDTRFVTPHRTRNSHLQLITCWETDQIHRLLKIKVHGGILRDHLGFGFRYPYSPIGRTRWELADARPDHSYWKAHIAALENREAFRDFRYSVKTRSGRALRLTTSGDPHYENECFLGYHGTCRFFSMTDESEQAA